MQNYPVVVQFILALTIVYILPTVIAMVISKWKYFPVILRTPVLFSGLAIINKLEDIFPVTEGSKNIAGYIYIILGSIFLFLIFKYKWFWNDEEKNDQDTN